ncbi:MAG: phosphotransferase family protein, partial [Actinomycetota bacterium]
MSAPEGIFEPSVTSWLNTSVDGAVGPYSWEIIAGGHSNLTFLVTDANSRRLVLRRPPLAHGLASAHDMAREHRIISALNRSSVPVPTTVGLCEDDRINGAPFYVMEYVDGHVVRDVEAAERRLSEPARARASESLADTLAAIHEVDLVTVGLNDLGRHEDYLARQLRRWYGQWEQQRTRDLSLIDDVHAVLIANLPAQQSATIVHGDYRLDNTMVDDDGNVCAVLDWEICTL